MKYGVDELFGDGDKDDIDLDLREILGPSVDGEWQPEETEGEEEAGGSGDGGTGGEKMDTTEDEVRDKDCGL